MNRFMDFFNRTFVYYFLKVILVVLSIVLCFVISSCVCYGKPSSLNTWWFICLFVLQIILLIYVMYHKHYTMYRIDENDQCLKDLVSIAGEGIDVNRDGWKRIVILIRLLPDEHIDFMADVLNKNFHNAFVEIDKIHTEKMSNLLLAVDELTSKSKNLLADYQKLEEINKLLNEQVEDLTRKLNYK